ncbi:MAG: coenzyme F420-0:L-glutamate ligase [Chloroflexi bacterium]|nr:coenzyme F420-0:L-glutamate ligase [Chloroflexota bacterium]
MQILPVRGIPEVTAGDDLCALVLAGLARGQVRLREGDVVVVTSKIVSKAEGRTVRLEDVEPSPFARAWAAAHGKDARQVEVVLRESRRIVRQDRGVLIAETHHGFVCANAGVDASNAGTRGQLLLLPEDPDASARGLRVSLRQAAGVDVAVVISDTFGRPWRTGQTNVAIGAAAIRALRTYAGTTDPAGYVLRATSIAVIDELAAAAELVMHKLARVPVAIIRGCPYERVPEGEPDAGAAALVRQAEFDLFR